MPRRAHNPPDRACFTTISLNNPYTSNSIIPLLPFHHEFRRGMFEESLLIALNLSRNTDHSIAHSPVVFNGRQDPNGRPLSLYASALITPPHGPNELTLPAVNPNQNSVASLRYRSVLPHSPVKTSADNDFEPLPYNDNNSAERSISPIFWSLMCSPLKAPTHTDDARSPHDEGDLNQVEEKQPPPIKDLPDSILSNSFLGSAAEVKKTHSPHTNALVHPGTHPTPFPHPSGWPMYPPPYFWYQQYPYYHDPRVNREDQQPRHSFPPLYPKPQHGPYQHAYHLPAPCDQFGNVFYADHPQIEFITEVTVNDVICG